MLAMTELLTTYMKPTYIKTMDLDKINPTNESNFKSIDEIYLGLGVNKQLSSNEIDSRLKVELKEKCRKFIVQACVGIRKRYSLDDPVMSAISKLDLENCLEDTRDDSLQPLFTLMPRLAPESLTEQQKLDDQWRKLPCIRNTININQAPDTFWHEVSRMNEFSLVAKFMLDILALPNSNAECERKFSEINDIKTKKRNRLITNTIKGNILAQQAIKRNATSCVNFKPNDNMMKAFNSTIYKTEPAPGLNQSDSD